MDRFGEMEEYGGRSGRGECGRDLAGYVPGLAKAADDQLALAFVNQANRILERSVEVVRERVEGPCLIVQNCAPEFENAY